MQPDIPTTKNDYQREPIIVSEIALGSSEVGVFSSVVVGAMVYEED